MGLGVSGLPMGGVLGGSPAHHAAVAAAAAAQLDLTNFFLGQAANADNKRE